MPTVILMDSSLSMLRPANKGSSESAAEESFQIMDLAKWGVDWLLNHLEKVFKLEQVAILAFGCQCDLFVQFTRDMPEVRAKVRAIFRLYEFVL